MRKRKLKILIKNSIYKSTIVVFLFIVVSLLSDFELFREKFEDLGFDKTLKIFFSTKKEKIPTAPNVIVFGFDDYFMHKNNLLDRDNATNYGYIFPRRYIASFIQELDEITALQQRLGKNPPKALFIDMDMSFGSLLEGNLSSEDNLLLDVLVADTNRSYPIIFPKTQTANFIEFSKREKIQQMIENRKIIFGSVGLRRSKDNAVRRYEAYKEYHNLNDNNISTYFNAQIILWKYLQKKEYNITSLKKDFKRYNIITNRIMFKEYQPQKYLNPLMRQSFWENYRYYSADYHFHGSDADIYSDSVIMLGTTYKNSDDIYEVLASGDALDMSGVEINANLLLTLFYLNGQLKPFPLWAMIPLVFILVFIIDFGVSYLLYKFKKKENKWTMIGVLFLTLGVMLLASLILLQYGYWFNWFIPMILYDVIDMILG